MSGYIDYSISLRAAEAYQDGAFTLSGVRAADLAGTGLTVEAFRAGVRAGIIASTEWHHTSKMYNRTDFFRPDDVREQIAIDPTIVERSRSAAGDGRADDAPVQGTLRYRAFSGSRRYRKVTEVTAAATLVGGWYHLRSGGRKKADGNHIISFEVPG